MTNIVLWYDNIDKNNCTYEDAVGNYNSILHKLMINDIEYTIKTTDQALKKSEINVYVIELLNVYHEYDIFSLIPDRTKKLFSEGLTILLYYPTEGHSFDNWLLRIYTDLQKNKILNSRIFLVSGDVDLDENYKKYIQKYDLKDFLIPISIDYFKGEYYETSNNFNESLELNRPKDYLFYNGKIRPHRVLAVAELKNRNLLNSGMVSLTGTTHTGQSFNFEDCIKVLKDHKCYHDHVKIFLNDWQPLILDEHPENFSRNTVYGNKENHYSLSFFSIVSETNIDVRFITEKTYKPIANCHPFLIIGAKGILTWLRDQGYKTFPEMFDESYDFENNHSKRIYMVLDQVEKFNQLSLTEKKRKFESVKEKLIYNKNLFFKIAETTKKYEFEKIFRTIKNYES